MNLKTIGTVESPFRDKFGTPRQSQIAKNTISLLRMDKKMIPQEMLSGLEVGTYIWVIFGFHLNNQKKQIVKVHPPRLRGKKMGVLATRSPHRPNPLGLSLAKISALQKNSLEVLGLDLVHGTPIYDIKPYLPTFDRPLDKARHWIEQNPFPKLKVSFARGLFSKNIPSYLDKNRILTLKKQLKEILCEDPRPQAYLQKDNHLYWLRYNQIDVGFTINEPQLQIVELKFL